AFATYTWPAGLAGYLILLLPGLVGAAVVAFRTRAPAWQKGLAVVFALLGAVALWQTKQPSELFRGSFWANRREVWSTTWTMLQASPWQGLGPGQMGSLSPRFMAATAGERAREPHDWPLEVWAEGGLFALLALAGALGWFFYRVARWWGGGVVD